MSSGLSHAAKRHMGEKGCYKRPGHVPQGRVRGGKPRQNGIAANAAAGVLQRRLLGEVIDGGLGDSVADAGGVGDETADGGDVDDASACGHVGDHQLGDPIDAADIQLQDLKKSGLAAVYQSQILPGFPMPKLFTRISMLPAWAVTASTMAA